LIQAWKGTKTLPPPQENMALGRGHEYFQLGVEKGYHQVDEMAWKG